jgi:hypothetical protein
MDKAKRLYRRLDALFDELKPRRQQPKHLEAFFEEVFDRFREDLRLRGGLLYVERRDGFAFLSSVGEIVGSPADNLDPDAAPVAQVIEHRVYIFGDPDAGAAPHRLGLMSRGATAGLVVGRRPQRYCFFFLLDEGWDMEELDFVLNTIRAALDARLADARVRGSFREAAEIQRSLLFEDPPAFPGYDIACPRTRWEATSTIFTTSGKTSTASRSATPAATGCLPPSSSGTSSRGSAWGSRRSSRSPTFSRSSTA